MFWLALLFYLPVFGQDSLEINYLIKLNQNLGGEHMYGKYNGKLRVINGKSLFFMEASEKRKAVEGDGRVFLDTFFIVKTDPENNALFVVEFLIKTGFLWVKDTLYPMKWTIDTATKRIGDFNCIKARCFFRGRNYTAWYTPDIPLAMGPWKLGGLPGLIVEVEDDNKDIVVSFGRMSRGATPFNIPKHKLEWAEFVIKRKKALEDFASSLKAQKNPDCLTCKSEVSVSIDNHTLETY